MKKNIFLMIICMALTAFATSGRGLRGGDLVFQPAGASGFEKAISQSTRSSVADFTHVGILDIVGTDTVVIEATPAKGVAVTPLAEFAEGCASLVFVKVDDPAAANAPAIARKYIGLPYDREFLPGNSAVYCSELVQLSYLRNDGSPLFPQVPMSFLDPSGRIPQYWLDFYAPRGMQVPHGTPGSSPNSIFAQCHNYKKFEKY